jgi:hypothetical protein
MFQMVMFRYTELRTLSNRETVAWLLFESWDELSDSVTTAACDFNDGESGSTSGHSDNEFEIRVDADGNDLNDKVHLDDSKDSNASKH